VTGLEDKSTGATGQDTYLYDPYGQNEKVAPPDPTVTTPPDDLGLSGAAQDNPFRFEGFYYDAGVKAYDMQAREYRPDLGHFLSQDRFESAVADDFLQADPLTQNRYAFAGGNPVNNVEFDGHGWGNDVLGALNSVASGVGSSVSPRGHGSSGAAPSAPAPLRLYNVGGGVFLVARPPPPRAAALNAAATFIRRGPCFVRACSNEDRLGLTEEAYRRILNGVNPGGLVAFGSQVDGSVESTDDLTNLLTATSGARLAFGIGRALFAGIASREGAGTLARVAAGDAGQAAKAGEEGVAGATAFHHTTTATVESIMRQGLRPGSYVTPTPTPGLSPLQAHIELALNPAGGVRNAVIDVDLGGLRRAGYEIPRVTRVTGAYKMAGGGYEMQFPYEIPPKYLSVRP
jgi:RHS repeat-associated protein